MDDADFIQKGAPEIFAEEGAFDWSFGVLALVHAIFVDDADIDDTLVKGAEADMDARGDIAVWRTKWRRTGVGTAAQVPHIDACAGDAADEGAFEHAR